ncbi:MAG: fumarylacetoacetase [Cyclobacteriaceae bacterium]
MRHLNTWVDVPDGSDFSIYNLPYGIYSESGAERRAGIAIGDKIVDLNFLQETGLLADISLPEGIFKSEVLNDFMALGKSVWTALRTRLHALLDESNQEMKPYADKALVEQSAVTMHMPVKVGDYTDFYSSEEHATNVGIMFRGKDNALMPNWKHIPVGYHGRASSIIVSGQPFHRPQGQTLPKDAEQPIFGPTKLLDIELEMAFITGGFTNLGEAIPTDKAEGYIFGMVLFNDWSARDIQKWEYVPLGPFLGKSFASSISPWIVTMEALECFKVDGPKQDPEVLPYLQFDGQKSYDINLDVYLKPAGGDEQKISSSNHKYMYWNMAQQLAHQTVNGCNINVGDLYGSGTLSGKEPDSYGSLLELTWGGQNPIKLNDGSERKFLQDHDTIVIKGHCEKDEVRIGFGEVRTEVLPQKP